MYINIRIEQIHINQQNMRRRNDIIALYNLVYATCKSNAVWGYRLVIHLHWLAIYKICRSGWDLSDTLSLIMTSKQCKIGRTRLSDTGREQFPSYDKSYIIGVQLEFYLII